MRLQGCRGASRILTGGWRQAEANSSSSERGDAERTGSRDAVAGQLERLQPLALMAAPRGRDHGAAAGAASICLHVSVTVCSCLDSVWVVFPSCHLRASAHGSDSVPGSPALECSQARGQALGSRGPVPSPQACKGLPCSGGWRLIGSDRLLASCWDGIERPTSPPSMGSSGHIQPCSAR